MRLNELTNLLVAGLVGLVLGVIGTVGAYNTVAGHQTEAERQEADQALKQAQDERDEALGRINTYLESERSKRLAAESPAGETAEPAPPGPQGASPKRTETAAAPRTPEPAPPPREQADTTDTKAPAPAPTFGPPRQSGGGK